MTGTAKGGRSNTVAAHLIGSSVPPYLAGTFIQLWFFNQFPVFLVGILTYHLLKNGREVGSMLVFSSLLAPIFLPYNTSNPVVYALAFGALAIGLSNGGGKLLVNRGIRFLGKVSYSGYFWHTILLALLNPFVGDENGLGFYFAFFPFLVVTTAACSWVTFTLIEQPFIRWANRPTDVAASAV